MRKIKNGKAANKEWWIGSGNWVKWSLKCVVESEDCRYVMIVLL